MKLFYFLALSAIVLQLNSQNGGIRIYRVADEVRNPSNDTVFGISIRHAVLKPVLILTQNDSTKVEFTYDKIWGFRDKDGKIYRNNGIKFLCMEGEADGLIMYCKTKGPEGSFGVADIRSSGGVGTYGQHYSSQSEVFYFSRSLDSKIFDFDKLSLKLQYEKDKPCFPEKLSQIKMGARSYSFLASALTPKKIIEIYTNCK